jgi:hypothetical protein
MPPAQGREPWPSLVLVIALAVGLLGCEEGESLASMTDTASERLDEHACNGAERARKRDHVAALQAEHDHAIARHELAITYYREVGFDVVADAAVEEIGMIRRSFERQIAEAEGRHCADMQQE